MRKTWETINELIGKSKKTNMDIEELIINQGEVDKIVTSGKDVAVELNNYFVTAGSNLAEQIQNGPPNCCFKDYLGTSN